MLERFFESYYRLRPVNATFTGVHEHDHRLPDWSPAGLEAAVDEMGACRASLAGGDGSGVAVFADVQVRDRTLARAFLDIQLAEHECGHFQRGNPSLAIGEAAFGVISLMTRPFASIDARADAATSRLSAVPQFLTGARKSMSAAVPSEWRARALRECTGADRLCETGIRKWIAAERIDPARADRLLAAARVARTAFLDFRSWLERDVPSTDTDGYAAGRGLFDLLLKTGHWCDRTRADLAAEVESSLDEALARLDEHARTAAAGGWSAVQQRLEDAHPTVDDYLPAFHRAWDECRACAESSDLVTWPTYPIRYVPIPQCTRDAAPWLYYLFYRSPAPFDSLPVHEYVVTPIDPDLPHDEQQRRLRASSISVIKLNHVVHHGGIGHHVQNYYAYQGESAIGRIAAVDCANRIGMFAGGTMAEGWACYATDLMEEAGFFTPDERLAQQHTRARLLARAVVDIRLHERSLTFDEATAVYRDRIGMTDQAARAEVCKNSMFPGTALMYWLGTDSMHRLRRERERAEGANFSLRRFHDHVLSYGSIPVPMIAQLMS